ncbi:MAG: 2OG-Fe(II) oxygenase [Saprospiraceae bacterium]
MSSKFLNNKYKDLNAVFDQYKNDYQNAAPFPSIYLDDFLNVSMLDEVLEEFPDLEKVSDVFYNNPNATGKFAANGETSLGPKTIDLVHYLNSQPFLEFLQGLTGIKETLLPDPYLVGGGFHQIKPGGFLKLHVDFHKHQKTKLDRRLNLLVYLNKDWKEEYGGHFELWEKDMSKSVTKILPIYNRMAMFSTTGDSWHGHPDVLSCPPDRSRKSLALYYYTNGRPDHEVPNKDKNRITTTFAVRKGIDGGDMKRYNTFVNLANDILPTKAVEFIKKFRSK